MLDDIPSTLFRDNLTAGDKAVSIMLLSLLITVNMYTIAKFVNMFRALITTRFFTDKPIQGGNFKEEPVVTIQICAYNEASVIEDTINAACNVDWPKDKLFVQICDDSTDETTDIIMAVAASWREKGVNCECLRRSDRIGYKAGSLHHHTNAIQGGFVAMFDSDHRAEPSFLRRAIPQFYDKNGNDKSEIGLVQLPWAYYNTHQNLLTEYDALSLDISHVIEQIGRSGALKCFGFNGTGGVWRKEAIQAGGGWQWDTVTEDLDLSYLAHLAGYDLIYLRDLPQQLELPAGIRAHVQQKHRWTKGFFQVLRKSLWNMLKSRRSSIFIKYECFFHFSASIGYTCALGIFLLSPIAVHRELFTVPLTLLGATSAAALIICAIITIYAKVPGSNGHYNNFVSRTLRVLIMIPVYCMLGLGMCVFETYALIDGLTSNDATFKRTPKEGSPAAAAAGGNANGTNPATSVLDFVNDDDDDDDDEGIGHESSSSSAEISNTSDESPKDLKKKKKSRSCFGLIPSKYFKDVCLGITGLLIVAYMVVWAVYIFRQGKQSFIFQLLVLAPTPGLLYIHGSFCRALLQRPLAKWWNSRRQQSKMSKDEEREGETPAAGGNDSKLSSQMHRVDTVATTKSTPDDTSKSDRSISDSVTKEESRLSSIKSDNSFESKSGTGPVEF